MCDASFTAWPGPADVLVFSCTSRDDDEKAAGYMGPWRGVAATPPPPTTPSECRPLAHGPASPSRWRHRRQARTLVLPDPAHSPWPVPWGNGRRSRRRVLSLSAMPRRVLPPAWTDRENLPVQWRPGPGGLLLLPPQRRRLAVGCEPAAVPALLRPCLDASLLMSGWRTHMQLDAATLAGACWTDLSIGWKACILRTWHGSHRRSQLCFRVFELTLCFFFAFKTPF